MLTIKDLFYSDVSTSGFSTPSPEYVEIRETYFALEKQLTEQLNEEQVRLHNQIIDAIGQMDALSNAAHYVQGFRDGAGILLDVVGMNGEGR